MPAQETIDCSECPLVEFRPGVHSGAAVLCGTRMPVDGVSISEIAEQFELSPERIEEIVAYAKSHRLAHPV